MSTELNIDRLNQSEQIKDRFSQSEFSQSDFSKDALNQLEYSNEEPRDNSSGILGRFNHIFFLQSFSFKECTIFLEACFKLSFLTD